MINKKAMGLMGFAIIGLILLLSYYLYQNPGVVAMPKSCVDSPTSASCFCLHGERQAHVQNLTSGQVVFTCEISSS